MSSKELNFVGYIACIFCFLATLSKAKKRVCVLSAGMLTHHVEEDRSTHAHADLVGGVTRVEAGLAARDVGEVDFLVVPHHPG